MFNTIFNDAPQNWQTGFQDPATPGFTGIIELHDTIFFYLIIICVGVFWVLGNVIFHFNSTNSSLVHKYLNHGTLIETVWTITPALILIAIAFPSFRLLYLLDEVISPTITIKVSGHQWYWSYFELSFDYAIIVKPLSSIQGQSLNINEFQISPSKNHANTLKVLEQGFEIPNKNLFSPEVLDFISKIRGRVHESLCMLTPNGDLIIPKGTSLGFKGHLPWLKDHSSIYLILRNETNEAYIGSSIDLSTRFRSHRDCGTSIRWINTSHLLYSAIGKYGTDAFTFTEIHPSTNFLMEFNSSNPDFLLTNKDKELLIAWTQYELAVIEQSYLAEFKPSLNGRYVATTSSYPRLYSIAELQISGEFVRMESNSESIEQLIQTTPLIDISHWNIDSNLKVQIYDIKGQLLGSFKSLREAAIEMESNQQLLSRYAKSIDNVFISLLGIKIEVICQGMEKIGHVIHPTTKLHPALEHNLMLPEGRICAINSDLKSVFNTYSSMYAAALALGLPSYRKIRRYIGQNFLVSTDKGLSFSMLQRKHLKIF